VFISGWISSLDFHELSDLIGDGHFGWQTFHRTCAVETIDIATVAQDELSV
jgi:hypothetical protein